MLEQVLMELHNWFRVRDNVDGIYHGEYTIQDGQITLPFLLNGQYFRIMGSVFNDGLHQYQAPKSPEEEPEEPLKSVSDKPEEEPENPKNPDLTDETFEGTIWALAVPKAVIDISDEVAVL